MSDGRSRGEAAAGAVTRGASQNGWGVLLGPWAAMALGLLVFANSLGNGFAYDDTAIIGKNARIRNLADWRGLMLTDWWAPQTPEQTIELRQRDRLYRPLTLVSFAVNYRIHQLSPLGYHVGNVLLHVAACGLVWLFVQRLIGDRVVAGLTALLFAVHPVHVEAVANVVGRAEVLSTVFLLLGFIALLPSGALAWVRSLRWGLCLPAFFAAVMAKETAISYLPIALVILAYSQMRHHGRLRWPQLTQAAVLLALPLAIYFPLRIYALGGHLIRDASPSELLNPLIAADGVNRLLLPFEVLGHYVRLLFAPSVLSCHYGMRVIDADRGAGPLALVGAGAIVLLFLAAWQARERELQRRTIGFVAVFALLSYGLISNSVLLIGVAVAERLFYWPSVPFLLLVVLVARAIWLRQARTGGAFEKSARLLQVGGAAVLLALAMRTVVRNPDWYDSASLFLADSATFPQCVDLQIGAAREWLRPVGSLPPEEAAVRIRAAMEATERALKGKPDSADAMEVRARALAIIGRVDEARRLLDTAMTIDAGNLGIRKLVEEFAANAQAEALREVDQQLATRPSDSALLAERGRRLLMAGRFVDAAPLLRDLAQQHAADVEIQRLYGDALLASRELEAATEQYGRVLRLAPEDWQTHINLSSLRAQSDDPRGALRHAEAAYAARPTELQSLQNLAEALARNERYEEALRWFDTIERGLAPDAPLRPVIAERIRVVKKLADSSK